MADFNPDQYLQEKTGSQGFNPDSYLQEKLGQRLPASSPNNSDSLQDFATSAVNAAQLGLGAQIQAGIHAGMDVASGLSSPSDLIDLYKQYEAQNRNENKQAAINSPKASFAGNLVGGAVPAVLTAGMINPAETYAGAALQGAGLGAGYGALAGAGESEGSLLDNPTLLAKDIGKGALGGAITGGVLSPVLHGVGDALGALKNSKLGTAFGEGLEGNLYLSKAGTGAIRSDIEEQSGDLASKILGAANSIGEDLQNSVNGATAQGVTIPIGEDQLGAINSLFDLYRDNNFLIDNKKVNDLFGKIFRKEDLTPDEAYTLKQFIKSSLGKLYRSTDPGQLQAAEIAKNFMGDLNDKIAQYVPGFQENSDRYHNFLNMIPETIADDDKFLSTAKDKESKISNDLNWLITRGGSEGRTGIDAKAIKFNLDKNVDMLESQEMLKKLFDPNYESVFDKMGMTAKDFKDQISTLTQRQSTLQATQGFSTPVGFNPNKVPANVAYNASNIAGRAMKKPVEIAKSVYEASDTALRGIADHLSQVMPDNYLSSSLINALDNRSDAAKNAVLFAMMQNPKVRTSVSDFLNQHIGQ